MTTLQRVILTIILALTVGVMGALVVTAQADAPLTPTADAYIALTQPNTPFGATDPNWLNTQGSRAISGLCSVTRQTLLKFDVSVLTGNVTTATLSLNYSEFTGAASGVIFGVWPTSDSWDELTVTWNTRPVSSGAPLATVASIPAVHTPLVFPSTAAMVNYVNSQRPANGGDGVASFITGYVDCPPLSAPQLRNTSRESALNLPPILDVEPFAGATPTNTPVGPTNTPAPPTATNTPLPPTATNTPAAPTPTPGATTEFGPVADTYDSQAQPTTVFGIVDMPHLVSQGSRSPVGSCNTTRYVWLRFDLSAFSGNATTVTLRLSNAQYSGPPSGVIVGVYQVTDDTWDENTLTWNNHPVGAIITPALATRSSLVGLTVLDWTSPAFVNYINAVINGDNLASMALAYVDCPTLSAPQFRVDSKEGDISPVLIIDAPVGATMTPTNTRTTTPSPTSTPSNTPTATIPTNTPTATNTNTPPPTNTNTPTRTNTATSTPTRTNTPPPTNTPTRTNTPPPATFTPTPCAPQPRWSDRAPIPVNRIRVGASGFTPNNRIYLLGGREDDTTFVNTIYEYNPATDTWTLRSATLPDLSSANAAAVQLTGPNGPRIYVIGGSATGSVTTGDVRVYDPIADTVTVLSSDPWPQGSTHLPGGWAVYNNILYIFGGFEPNVGMTNAIWRFDPMAAPGAKWTQLSATLGLARGYIATQVLDGYIYLAGGSQFSGGTLTNEVIAERFDPATNTITAIADLPTAASNFHGFAYNTSTGYPVAGKFYAAGGVFPTAVDMVQVYDPPSNTWTTGALLVHATRNYGHAQMSGYFFAFGGYATTPSNYTQRYEHLGPCPPTSVELAQFEGSATEERSWPDALVWLAPAALLMMASWMLLRRRVRGRI